MAAAKKVVLMLGFLSGYRQYILGSAKVRCGKKVDKGPHKTYGPTHKPSTRTIRFNSQPFNAWLALEFLGENKNGGALAQAA